jgi:hypothetical protein
MVSLAPFPLSTRKGWAVLSWTWGVGGKRMKEWCLKACKFLTGIPSYLQKLLCLSRALLTGSSSADGNLLLGLAELLLDLVLTWTLHRQHGQALKTDGQISSHFS